MLNYLSLQGSLRDGTQIAIKCLSAESKQGTKEFLTEINMIWNVRHPNLVQLIGCCVEDNNRILVYEYLENNSLANALLGKYNLISPNCSIWKNICESCSDRKMCLFVRGLYYVHVCICVNEIMDLYELSEFICSNVWCLSLQVQRVNMFLWTGLQEQIFAWVQLLVFHFFMKKLTHLLSTEILRLVMYFLMETFILK